MTLAKPPSNHTGSFELSAADAVNPQSSPSGGLTNSLDDKLTRLSSQVIDGALSLWTNSRPGLMAKLQAVWQLLRSTQPVQLLLAAALAVLAIALITLVTVFNGLIIFGLKLSALALATVAVGQWVVRGANWANKKLLAER